MVAGTFHVPSAVQKPLVFEATAHECACYFLRIQKNHSLIDPNLQLGNPSLTRNRTYEVTH